MKNEQEKKIEKKREQCEKNVITEKREREKNVTKRGKNVRIMSDG